MNKPKHDVGDRVRVEAGEGEVTEFVADRKCYRIRLDDGRVQTVPEDDVKAGRKKGTGADREPADTATRTAPEQTATHKMVEGPARS